MVLCTRTVPRAEARCSRPTSIMRFLIGAGVQRRPIIYNSATGELTYNSNGNAAGGAFKFATLTTKPTITNADFVVIGSAPTAP